MKKDFACTCGADSTRVNESRPVLDFSIRRRRVCLSCGRRFTTYEIEFDGRTRSFSKETFYEVLLRYLVEELVTLRRKRLERGIITSAH